MAYIVSLHQIIWKILKTILKMIMMTISSKMKRTKKSRQNQQRKKKKNKNNLEGCGYGFSNCSEFNQVQFRPLVNMTAGGMSGFDAETNNRTVYYDDIEFLE